MKEQYFPATTPFVYRVPIRTPSRAKIASIAAHKRNQIAAAAAKIQSTKSAENKSELPVEALIDRSSSSSIDNSSSGNDSNTAGNNHNNTQHIMKTSSSIDQLLAKPNIQEELRRELEDLNKYSELIKKDIRTLSNIRGNVLWLLKKVTYSNTLKNHKGENVIKITK